MNMLKKCKNYIILFIAFIAMLFLPVGCNGSNNAFTTESTTDFIALIDETALPTTVSTTESTTELSETETTTEEITIEEDTSEETATEETTTEEITTEETSEAVIDEDGVYSSKEDVALYLYTYNKLPNNYITKKEAKSLGWTGGGLDDYAYGCCLGGDYFGNNEGLLPSKNGRKYFECDIDTLHKKKRGRKRIIYSNDGLIYYTEDHYESFELLYGE